MNKRKSIAISAVALALSAGGLAVHAATDVTLDLRPYIDAPAANHDNPYDGFGYLESALLDRVHDDVEAALAGGSTTPIDELADVAWRGVNRSPSDWHLICVCVMGPGCPCKDFFTILGGIPPEELDADVHRMLAQQPSQRPTRSQILTSARANLHLSNPAAVARAYDDMMALVEAVSRGSMSGSDFQQHIEVMEWSWKTGLRGDDRDFLLQSAAIARHVVQYARNTGCSPEAAECVDYAILGATLAGWAGAVVAGGGCLVSKLPWYPE